jgi:voltage-gated potassium channel
VSSLRRALLYFSYVTQTTMGYGDLTPATPLARSLATLQAIAGQLYLAVLVARLVAENSLPGSRCTLTRRVKR